MPHAGKMTTLTARTPNSPASMASVEKHVRMATMTSTVQGVRAACRWRSFRLDSCICHIGCVIHVLFASRLCMYVTLTWQRGANTLAVPPPTARISARVRVVQCGGSSRNRAKLAINRTGLVPAMYRSSMYVDFNRGVEP